MSANRSYKAFSNRRGPPIPPASTLRKNANDNESFVPPPSATTTTTTTTTGGLAAKSETKGSLLLVRSLPEDVTFRDVDDLFRMTIGPLISCKLLYDPKGSFEGMALVEFVSPLDAAKAWEVYNGMKIDQKIPLELFLIYPSPMPASTFPPPSLIPTAPRPTPAAFRPTPTSKPTPRGPSGSSARVPLPKPKNVKSRSGQTQTPLSARLGPPVIPLESRLGPLPHAASTMSLSLTPFGQKSLPGGPKAGPGGKKKSGPIKKPIIKKKNGPKKAQNRMDGVQKI